jgi:hypothetical protein
MNKSLKIILFIAAIFYLAFIAGTSFVVQNERYFTLVDDAMISMRYARNLAQGHGLVWNVGEAPVQGFTNFGWTLYMGFLHLFPFAASKISLAVMLTSALILLGNIIVVHKIAEVLAPESKFAPMFAAIVTAFYFPLVFWSLRGMEVGALVLLVDLALLLAINSKTDSKVSRLWSGKRTSGDVRLRIGLILSLAIFVRIDAVIAAVVIVAYLFFKDKKSFIIPAVMVALTTIAILYFQQTYFGDFLPTTYYQKVTGYTLFARVKHGLLMFNEFATRDTLFLFLFSLAGIFFYKQFTLETYLLAAIFLAQCAYSIYVGGDYAEFETNAANRFVTQGMSALLILFAWMMSRVLSDLIISRTPKSPDFGNSLAKSGDFAVPLAVIVLIIISGEPWTIYAIDNAPLLKADIRRVKLGLHIARNTDPEAVIAVHAAGQIPYYANRATIDLLGLNDPIVAKGQGNGEFYPGHNKWDYDYSIGQLQPDLIADNFTALSGYMRGHDQYQMLESDIYIRKDSAYINVNGLSSKEYR